MTETRQYFGSIRICWAAMTHHRFLLLIFCLLLCLERAASAQSPETFTDTDGNGLWSDGNNWNPPTGSGGPNGNFNVTIPLGVGGPTGGAILDVSASIVNLTINTNAGLNITNASILTITGTSIANNGQIAIVDMSGFATGGYIVIPSNAVTLSGSGVTILNSSTVAEIGGGGTLISQQAIKGYSGGVILTTLENQGPNGIITGGPLTAPLLISGKVTNTGLISGVGFSAVELSNNRVINSGGTIDGGMEGGEVLLNNATIIGGTIGSATAVAGSSFPTLNAVTITGVYYVISTTTGAAGTTLKGKITNNGAIFVNSPTGGQAATLTVNTSVALAGTGEVELAGQGASITGTGTLTNLVPHVITGLVGGGSITVSNVVNESTITGPITIAVTSVNNTNGIIGANGQPVTINGGTVTGGTINAGSTPGVTLNSGGNNLPAVESSVAITGGPGGTANAINALLTEQVMDASAVPTTISTVVQIPDNGKLTLEGPVTVSSPGGEILLNAFAATSNLIVEGSVTISGTGELVTSTAPNNVIVGNSGTTNSLTLNVPTVNYQGTIGDGTFPITVGVSTIVTNGGYPLIINATNSTFTNHGTMVETDSTIDIEGNFANYNSTTNTLTGGIYTLGGTLQFNNANLVNNSAKLTLNGNGQILNQNGANGLLNFSNNTSKGTFTLSNEQSFETGGTFSNEGTVDISAGSSLTIGGTSTNYNQSGTTAVTMVDGKLSLPTGGSANITGGTLQGAGQLYGDVSVGNAAGGAAATLIVGDSRRSSALVTMTNNYTQLATGVMDVQIGGFTAGTLYSQLSVTGPVTLGGTLNVAVINNFKPSGQFTIINAPSGVTGTFATVTAPKNFHVVYNSTSAVLEVQ